ncbi:MAG: hypothetical protein ACYTG4_12700, partial [Planctomycetota bacterium]
MTLPSALLALQEAAPDIVAPDVGGLLNALVPELVLTAGLLVILFIEIFWKHKKLLAPRISLGVTLAALILAFRGFGGDPIVAGPLLVDDMAILFRLIFNAAAALTLVYAMRTDEEWFDEAEFHVMFLASLIGM